MIVALALMLVCFGEVVWGVHNAWTHEWYSTGLMILAYLIHLPMLLLGLFWAFYALVLVIDKESGKETLP